jgi:hypothetical protein
MAYSYIVNQSRGGTVGKPGPPVQANVAGQLVLIYEVLEIDPGPTDEFVLECLPPVGRCTLYQSQLTGPNAPFGAYLPEFGTAPGFVADTLDAIPADVPAFGNPALHLPALFAYSSPSGKLHVRSNAAAAIPVPLEIRHRFTIIEGHEGPTKSADNSVESPIELRFLHPDFGEELAQNGLFSGVPVLIYDGDNPGWTTSNVVGAGVDFASVVRPFPPSLVSAEVFATTGNIWEFDFGSLIDLSTKNALSMRINVDKDWTTIDTIVVYGWDGVAQVGNSVSLSAYFEQTMTDMWQSFGIPLSDMGLSTSSVSAFRMEVTVRDGARPLWYLDDFYLQESGGPLLYDAFAPPTTIVEITKLVVVLVDAVDTTEVDGTLYGLKWDQLLGLAKLPNGLLFQQLLDGTPTPVQALVRDLVEVLEGDFDITNAIAKDGEAAIKLTLVFPVPILVLGVPGSALRVSVQDDLTGLIRARAKAFGRVVF